MKTLSLTTKEKYMPQPNIVFVFADQLRYDALGCNGNRIVQTPNIDTLARDGICFDQAFSATPICSPYRAQILTGNFAHTNGVVCNEYRLFDDQRTLPQVLGENGFRTAYVGKWHLGYGPYYPHKRYGFDDMYAYNLNHSYYDISYWHNEDGPRKFVEYAPFGETEIAIDYLRENAARPVDGDDHQPVCLMLSWGPPHWNRLSEPRRYGDYPEEFNIYDPEEIPLSPNIPAPLRPNAQRETADYYGMVTSLDECMGRLLDSIDEMGIAENTIVCFSSDHGDFLGSHGYLTPADTWLPEERRLSKASPYTEACKIPLLIRWPGQTPAHRRSECLFNSVDVMPTLLSLCGIQQHEMQGTDLSHAVLGKSGQDPESIYLEILGPGFPNRDGYEVLWRAVRTHRHIYAKWMYPKGRRLLIDLVEDPLEMQNLANDPSHANTVAKLDETLNKWMEKANDPFETGNRLPLTRMLDLGQAFITSEWLENAPPEYAESIKENHKVYRTGEQENDPIKGRTVS
jgi:arylsulfatase A-like enzyme